jgi:hypothetical protein
MQKQREEYYLPLGLPFGLGIKIEVIFQALSPVGTMLPERVLAVGSLSPVRAAHAITPSGDDSLVVSRCEVGRSEVPVGELEVRASSTGLSSPLIAKGMERSTSTNSLSVPLAPAPSQQPPVVRRSGRHAMAEDGLADTNEDMMQKAMRRKAEKNLDVSGNKKSASFIKFQILISLLI